MAWINKLLRTGMSLEYQDSHFGSIWDLLMASISCCNQEPWVRVSPQLPKICSLYKHEFRMKCGWGSEEYYRNFNSCWDINQEPENIQKFLISPFNTRVWDDLGFRRFGMFISRDVFDFKKWEGDLFFSTQHKILSKAEMIPIVWYETGKHHSSRRIKVLFHIMFKLFDHVIDKFIMNFKPNPTIFVRFIKRPVVYVLGHILKQNSERAAVSPRW